MNVTGLLHAILTCVTAGPGLGFNRAVLFLADEQERHLEATKAIGPGSPEEAQATWEEMSASSASLDDLLRIPPNDAARTSFQRQIEGLQISLSDGDDSDGNPLLEAYRSRRLVKIADAAKLDRIPARLREVFGGTEVVCVPLVAHDRAIGLLVADNAFTRTPIHTERVQLLQVLALLASQALDGVRVYRELERQADRLRQTIQELRATQEQLLHSERLATVGAVVARVSHEIRNPLSTIGGFARTLARRPDDVERVTRNSRIIVDEVEKLEGLLKEMLDFTSPHPPVLTRHDLNDVVRALLAVHHEALAEQDVTVDLVLAEGAVPVQVDRDQLQRALLNLVQNGVQAMEIVRDPKRRHLQLRTWRDESAGYVAVQDGGCGIPDSVLTSIFNPFVTTKARGTGLGLAVVKKIVDDHHGRIDVQTRPGTGSIFIIILPIER